MTFGRRWVAATAVLPLLLGACSGDPEPKFAPPSVSPSVSETPAPTAEPSREPWEKKTEAGAVAFAKHWVDVLNRAGASGDTADLESLSTADCVSCKSLSGYIDEVYGSGGHIASDGWKILEVGDSPGGSRGGAVTTAMQVRQAKQRIFRPGEDVATVEPTTFTVSFGLGWADSQWRVARAEILQ